MTDYIEKAQRDRRENNLMMEYGFIKNYRVVLLSPDGYQNTSYRVEELFEMFELVRKRNEHQS